MAYDINAALERLEQNLKNIDSARTQVEKTVSSSEKIRQIISNYVSTLGALNTEVSTLIKEIKTQKSNDLSQMSDEISHLKSICNDIVQNFDKDITISTTDFRTKTNLNIQELSNKVKELDEEISKLSSLKDTCNTILKQISETKQKINSEFEKISPLKNICSSIQTQTNNTTKNLNDISISLKKELDNNIKKIYIDNQKTYTLIKEENEKEQQYIDTIKSYFKEHSDSMDSRIKNLENQTKNISSQLKQIELKNKELSNIMNYYLKSLRSNRIINHIYILIIITLILINYLSK